jgi:metallo-beta-lactamase class B
MRRTSAGLTALAAAVALWLAGPAAADPEPSWTAPMAPFRISGDLYYVGSQELTSYLIVTSKGYILLDSGVAENAPMVMANVRQLGFDPRRIKILLNSHAHYDHAGGLAAIKAATGARFVASRPDASVLESGGVIDFAHKLLTNSFGAATNFPPIKVDRLIADGEKVELGGVALTAHVTAGHTKGCTSWTMPLMVDGRERQVLFICSLTILPGYRLTGDPNYPQMGEDFARTYKVMHALPCEVFLASHGSFYGLLAKRQAMLKQPSPNPFVDPKGCAAYIAASEAHFHRVLAEQTGHAAALP